MKNFNCKSFAVPVLLSISFLLAFGCEKRVIDDLKPATFNRNGEVFIDGFSGGLSYAAFGNSFYTGFNVDNEVKYSGTSSMKFDVPNEGNAEGAYVGGIYMDSTGRDLTGYDALTFWAKSSQSATINELGIGNDFALNKYVVTVSNVQLSTYWKKYIIPIPDASKLSREKGLFWYSEGPENGKGYTFWIDEVRYEKLGTIKAISSAIFGGKDLVQNGFVNSKIKIDGLTHTVNMVPGGNLTIGISPAYFSFQSTNPAVATVDEFGFISIKSVGSAVIYATIGGKTVSGSMTINASSFQSAPVPALDPSQVISLYSNQYQNVKVDYFNGYWQPYQTTQSLDIEINGDNVISYSNFNFVGIEFRNPTVDAREMTYLHLDVFPTDAIVAETALYVDLVNLGNPTNTRGSHKFASDFLVANQWNSCEVPVSIISQKDKVFQIILNAPANLMKNIYVDNIYFHK